MTTGADIVREARSWIGTRWHHQAATKLVGCDCIGLLRGVALNCGLFDAKVYEDPEVQALMRYPRTPFAGQLEKGADSASTRISPQEAKPGDFVILVYNGDPHHIGILGDYVHGGLSLIHAYAPARKVIETRLDDSLRRRIYGWYRLPGVQG